MVRGIIHNAAGDALAHFRTVRLDPCAADQIEPYQPEIIGPQLIGLCGDAGAGKSTAAAILEAQGYTRLRFAESLKAMICALLTSAGMTDAEAIRCTDGDTKEAPLDVLGGQTPRHAMQMLGTEWGRQRITGDLWVRITMARAEALLAEGKQVVIDDVRFPNEAAAVRWGVMPHPAQINDPPDREVWQVVGRGGIDGGHVSERQDFPADMVLDNSTSPEALETQILVALLG